MGDLIRDIKLYIFSVIILFIILFTDLDITEVIPPWLIIVMLVLAIAGFVYALVKRFRKKNDQSDSERNESVKLPAPPLKQWNEKITVSFSNCEVINNNYFEEETISSDHTVQFYDGLNDDGQSNTTRVEVNQSMIVFRHVVNGKPFRFVSPMLPFDRVTLLWKLEMRKETTLYYDKENPRNFYFDLRFLENK